MKRKVAEEREERSSRTREDLETGDAGLIKLLQNYMNTRLWLRVQSSVQTNLAKIGGKKRKKGTFSEHHVHVGPVVGLSQRLTWCHPHSPGGQVQNLTMARDRHEKDEAACLRSRG